MTTPPKQTQLTAEAFLEWAAAQPQGRFELSGGETVAMVPERIAHTRVKYEVMIALRNAIALGGSAARRSATGSRCGSTLGPSTSPTHWCAAVRRRPAGRRTSTIR